MCILVLAGVAEAQTICDVNCTALAGSAVTVFTDRQSDVASYGPLIVNGSPSAVPVQLTATTADFAFPSGFQAGTYTFSLRCQFTNGTSDVCTQSNTLKVETATQPAPPPVQEWSCVVAQQVKRMSGGREQFTITCADLPFVKGDSMIVRKP